MTDCVIRSRIDPTIKVKADKLFEQMGLSLSEAIRIFLYQAVAEKRIPFQISIPNEKTRKVLMDSDRGKNISKSSLKQLDEDWENACDN